MLTISVSTNKGGVGKTTLAANLAAYLAAKNYRVLAVDMDGQANLTWSAGVHLAPDQSTIMDALVSIYRDGKADAPVVHTSEGYDLIPAAESLAQADVAFANYPRRWSLLRCLLESVKDTYDIVLIDCPPAFALGSTTSLIAAGFVLIVTEASMLPMLGVKRMFEAIEVARTKNPDLKVIGIAINRWRGTSNNKMALVQLKEAYPDSVFNTVIRESTVLSEAPAVGKSVFSYRRSSNAAQDMACLAEEILCRINNAYEK